MDNQDTVGSGGFDATLAQRTVVVVSVTLALVALAALIWSLSDVLLLAFGSVLVAAILHAIADPIARWTPLSQTWALVLSAVLLLIIIGGAVWLFQVQVVSQMTGVLEVGRQALTSLGERIGEPGLAEQVERTMRDRLTHGAVLGTATSYGMAVLSGVTNIVLVLFGGAYLVAGMSLYRAGVVKLFPKGARPRIGETIDTAGSALKLWLLGQLFAMLATGALVWLAMWMIGLPSPFGLGMIAAVTEFIPLLGPFLGAIPAVLIAFSQGTSVIGWTIATFVIIQQIESNLIQPMITRRAASLPPLLLLFAFIALGSLFGLLGALLAAPLTVVLYVAVKKLYLRDTLGERTEIPGEAEA